MLTASHKIIHLQSFSFLNRELKKSPQTEKINT